MNITNVKYKEIMGECVNLGTLKIEHDFIKEADLITYLRENWFNLEEAERIKSIEIDPNTEGDFKLTLSIIE